MVKCYKGTTSTRICELGVTGCEVQHLMIPGQDFSALRPAQVSDPEDLGRRRSDSEPKTTSNAARLLAMESYAYDGGTRRNLVNFLTFQVPNLLEGLAHLIKTEQTYLEAKSLRLNPIGATITEHQQLLAALGCTDITVALAKIETLKAQAQLNSWPVHPEIKGARNDP